MSRRGQDESGRMSFVLGNVHSLPAHRLSIKRPFWEWKCQKARHFPRLSLRLLSLSPSLLSCSHSCECFRQCCCHCCRFTTCNLAVYNAGHQGNPFIRLPCCFVNLIKLEWMNFRQKISFCSLIYLFFSPGEPGVGFSLSGLGPLLEFCKGRRNGAREIWKTARSDVRPKGKAEISKSKQS